MYAQNCSFLPNKKQSAFNSSFPHNIGLLRNFTSQSFPKFDSSTHSRVDTKHSYKDFNINQHTSRTTSIMDFLYTFSDSSRTRMRETLSNKPIGLAPDKSRHNCKQIISHYNPVTRMPFISSHLVGGFVGSKSQLGRRPTRGFGVNMWDIIRELVGVFGNSSPNIFEKGNTEKSSFIGKKCSSTDKLRGRLTQTNMNNNSNSINNRRTKLKDAHSAQKQSYADVVKDKLELPLMQEMSPTSVLDQINSQMECSSVLEHLSMCNESESRNRITSECSIDSEDSFIVFECCERDGINIADDDYSTSDDDYSTSDDDSVEDFQIQNKESITDRNGTFIKAFNSIKDHKILRKKVQFAEGKDLTEVHPMVTWDYAYRAARRGPWEMLARDSARFRYRIASTEAILLPVLDPAHREVIYQQRFAFSETDS